MDEKAATPTLPQHYHSGASRLTMPRGGGGQRYGLGEGAWRRRVAVDVSRWDTRRAAAGGRERRRDSWQPRLPLRCSRRADHAAGYVRRGRGSVAPRGRRAVAVGGSPAWRRLSLNQAQTDPMDQSLTTAWERCTYVHTFHRGCRMTITTSTYSLTQCISFSPSQPWHSHHPSLTHAAGVGGGRPM